MLIRPILALLLLWNCGEPPPTPPGDAELTVGTGEGQFRTFEDGETLQIVMGTQGLQHVWVGLQASGIERRGTLIDLELRRASDDMPVSQVFRVRVSMQPVDGEDNLYELYGLALVIPRPEEAVGEDLILRAVVTDREDVVVERERPLRIEWP